MTKNETWQCEKERTIKTSTWVAERKITQRPNLLRKIDAAEHKLQDILCVETSIAKADIVRDLKALGLSPCYRYKKGDRVFESWRTLDGITSSSITIKNGGKEFVEKMMASEPMLDERSKVILENKLAINSSFSFETWFEDGIVLLSRDRVPPGLNLVATKTGATNAETFLIHRRAVENRSKEIKALRDEDLDDLINQNSYFVNYGRPSIYTLTFAILKRLF